MFFVVIKFNSCLKNPPYGGFFRSAFCLQSHLTGQKTFSVADCQGFSTKSSVHCGHWHARIGHEKGRPRRY